MNDASRAELPLGAVALIALFVTALITAQVISAKLLAIGLPVVGVVVAPGGTLAYAATFFASDCLAELYGERITRRVVNTAFFMNFVLVGLVFVTIEFPAASGSVEPTAFRRVLGFSVNIVLGSLTAYLLSQNWDVFVFHRIRESTGERLLWLRNIASTGSSQLIDTIAFTLVAFLLAPTVLGVGTALPLNVIWSLVVGQYLLKVLIALVDTPVVYATVALVRRSTSGGQSEAGSPG